MSTDANNKEPLRVRHHSAIVIVKAEKTDEFLCAIYDNTYPLTLYRGRFNLLGGNRDNGDVSPLATLQREITEEFSHNESLADETIADILGEHAAPEREGDFAPNEDLIILRDVILKHSKPLGDFVYYVPLVQGGPKAAYTAIESAFVAIVPQEVFELARKHIAAGRRLTNEGHVRIITKKELLDGKYFGAHDAAVILSEYLGVTLPNAEYVTLKPLGPVRASYADYSDVVYER